MNHGWVVVAAAFGSTLITAGIFSRGTILPKDKSWDQLIAEIEPINVKLIEDLALDHLNPRDKKTRLEPYQMWLNVGGMAGLRKLQHNANIICALAAYAIRWDFDEATIVTEEVRREAVAIKRAIARATRYGLADPVKQLYAPFNVVEIAVAYHLMRNRVLTLYKSSHAGLYPSLAGVI